MPVRATPEMAVAKWLQNLSASSERMQQGALAVTKAPGAAAAAAKQKWLARVTASADKFATNVGRVTLESWQNSYITVGIPRVGQGANAKQGKVLAFHQQFLPYLKAGVAQIDNMPSVTIEDGIARATAMIRYNAKFKRQ